ncbi:MAG: thiamine diphosphokinase [Bacteroidota bacterium]
MKALVICNGEPPSRTLLRRHARAADLIVAADGGANSARVSGVRPDIIIGDLDSLRASTRKHFASSLIIHVKRQDNTDLEKALDILSPRVKNVVIVAATGRRLDFTLGNLSVLWKYAGKINITVAGDGWQAFPIQRKLIRRVARGATVSLIPFGSCSGITLSGLKYPLTNARMTVGEIGVSNVAVRSPFKVSVGKGNMLVLILDSRKAKRS